MPITLLHGWGFGAAVWRPFVYELSLMAGVQIISLPGYDGQPDMTDISAVIDWVAGELPPHTLLLGWSLGGLLALDLARHCSERVRAVGLVASLPCFARQPDWPAGWETTAAAEIRRQLDGDPVAAIQHVAALSAHGDQSHRLVRRSLRACTEPTEAALSRDLDYLMQADRRDVLAQLPQPVYAWLGENDALLGHAAAAVLRELRPAMDIQVMAAAGHAPLLSQPRELARAVESRL